jgi:hypothetical protein
MLQHKCSVIYLRVKYILPRTGVWSVIYTFSALVPPGAEEIMDDDTSASVVGLDFRVLNSAKQNAKFSSYCLF